MLVHGRVESVVKMEFLAENVGLCTSGSNRHVSSESLAMDRNRRDLQEYFGIVRIVTNCTRWLDFGICDEKTALTYARQFHT